MNLEVVCFDEKYMPEYANQSDACMDLKIRIKERNKYLNPGQVATFGTGLKVKIPEDYVMLIYPRSSTGFKLNCMFSNGTSVIDPGYRGEIKLSIYNFGKYSVELEDGQRVAQFMIIPRPKLKLIEVADDDKFKEGNRGGGIGSTGR